MDRFTGGCLCGDVDFLLRMAQALDDGRVESSLARTALAPGAQWGIELYLAYQDPDIRAAVARLADSRNASEEVKEAASSLLNGSQAAYVQAYRSSEPFPKLRCQRLP